MRFVLPALLLSAAVSIANIYVRSPVAHKETLLGTWEGVNGAEDGYLLRMVLVAGDDGYLIWPHSPARDWPDRNRFFGRLKKLELKKGHLKLLFHRVPRAEAYGTLRGYDSIEIEGRVFALEGVEEMKNWALLTGTATARGGDRPYTYKIEMRKEERVRDLAELARRADDELSNAIKPGPIGSREDALEILRKFGEIVPGPPGAMDEGTRIISAEWDEDSRRWVVELQRPNGGSVKLSVDVPAKAYGYCCPDETR